MNFKARYKSGSVKESITDLIFNKGINVVSWVSDFDPFLLKSFEQIESVSHKFINYRNINKYLLENDITNKKILQSSMFLFGLNDNIKDKLIYCLDDIYSKLSKNNIDCDTVKINKIAGDATKLVIDFVFLVGGEVVNQIGLAYGSLELCLGAFELIKLANAVKACIPENLKLTKDRFLTFLSDLRNYITIASFESIIRVNYYYEIKAIKWGNDVPHIDLRADYLYEIKTFEKYYENDTLTDLQDETLFRGKLCQIKDGDDFEKAKNHNYIFHNFINTSLDRTISVDDLNLPNYLHDGEYHWYLFVAPKTGCFKFYSTGDNDLENNLDPYGEIYESILAGNASSNEILTCDDNSGKGKNFAMFYNLIKNQQVYIRIRGSGWKGHGYYSLNVVEFGDSNLDVKSVPVSSLNYPCAYGGNASTNKTLDLGNNEMMYVKSQRCGYVRSDSNGYYLTLSCYSKNIREAYIFFSFDRPILRFSFDIGLWGKKEVIADGLADLTIGVASSNSDKYRFSAELYRCLAIDNLSKDRDNLETKVIPFKESDRVYGIMINIMTNLETNSTSNRGRIVLDNFYFGF